MYLLRSTAFPSSALTVTAGAAVPTSMPRSCPRITFGAPLTASADAKTRIVFLNSIQSVPSPAAGSYQQAAISYQRCSAPLKSAVLDQQLPHLHKVILRNAQHDQRK